MMATFLIWFYMLHPRRTWRLFGLIFSQSLERLVGFQARYSIHVLLDRKSI